MVQRIQKVLLLVLYFLIHFTHTFFILCRSYTAVAKLHRLPKLQFLFCTYRMLVVWYTSAMPIIDRHLYVLFAFFFSPNYHSGVPTTSAQFCDMYKDIYSCVNATSLLFNTYCGWGESRHACLPRNSAPPSNASCRGGFWFFGPRMVFFCLHLFSLPILVCRDM